MQDKPPRLVWEPSPQYIRKMARDLRITESEVIEQLKLASDERLAAITRSREVSRGRQGNWREWLKEFQKIDLTPRMKYSKVFVYSQGNNYYIVIEDYVNKIITKTHRYASFALCVLAHKFKNYCVDVREKL